MGGLKRSGDRGPVSLVITRKKTNFFQGICDFKIQFGL